ncbi:MAG: hypothetical protein JXA81_12330 [Sedimentisphaerales bacterium]|nr:hypothetical protein [Sedimentisphaerales bacterium]
MVCASLANKKSISKRLQAIPWAQHDENTMRIFLDNNKPGVIISRNQYITEVIASMLPTQPAYEETCYKWESPDRKYRVWLINQDNIQTETKT